MKAISGGRLSFPSLKEVLRKPLKELQAIWWSNNEVLTGIIAIENPPRFGTHGASKRGMQKIIEHKKSLGLESAGRIFIAATQGKMDPVTDLSDALCLVENSFGYDRKRGGIFIINPVNAVRVYQPIMYDSANFVEDDLPNQRKFVELQGRSEAHWNKHNTVPLTNTHEFLQSFNPDNYESIVQGLIKGNEVPYRRSDLTRTWMGGKISWLAVLNDRQILIDRLRIQAVLTQIFERLGVLRLENAPWESYQSVGRELLQNVTEVTKGRHQKLVAASKRIERETKEILKKDPLECAELPKPVKQPKAVEDKRLDCGSGEPIPTKNASLPLKEHYNQRIQELGFAAYSDDLAISSIAAPASSQRSVLLTRAQSSDKEKFIQALTTIFKNDAYEAIKDYPWEHFNLSHSHGSENQYRIIAARDESQKEIPIIGFIELSENGDSLDIRNVYVDPASQGRGIGTILMGYAYMFAKEHGYQALELIPTEGGDQLFLSLGFTLKGLSPEKWQQLTPSEKLLAYLHAEWCLVCDLNDKTSNEIWEKRIAEALDTNYQKVSKPPIPYASALPSFAKDWGCWDEDVPPPFKGPLISGLMRNYSGAVRIPGGRTSRVSIVPKDAKDGDTRHQRIIKTIVETAYRIPGQNIRYTLDELDLQGVLENKSIIPDYSESGADPRLAFAQDIIASSNEKCLKVINVKETQQTIRGLNQNEVLFVTDNDSPSLVIKDIVTLEQPKGGYVHEIVSHALLKSIPLKHSALAQLEGVGKYKDDLGQERGMIAYAHASGEGVASMIIPFKTLPVGSVEREAALSELSPVVKHCARALAELHTIKSSPKSVVSRNYLVSRFKTFEHMVTGSLEFLEKNGRFINFDLATAKKVFSALEKSSGSAGLVHGDAWPPNFLYDKQSSVLTMIDTGSLMDSVNRRQEPIGMPAMDFHQFIAALEELGIYYGMQEDEIALLHDVFKKEYYRILAEQDPRIDILNENAQRFAYLYWFIYRVHVLSSENNPQNLILLDRLIDSFEKEWNAKKGNSLVGELLRNDSGAVRIPGGDARKSPLIKSVSVAVKKAVRLLNKLDFKSMSSSSLMGVGIPSKINQGKQGRSFVLRDFKPVDTRNQQVIDKVFKVASRIPHGATSVPQNFDGRGVFNRKFSIPDYTYSETDPLLVLAQKIIKPSSITDLEVINTRQILRSKQCGLIPIRYGSSIIMGCRGWSPKKWWEFVAAPILRK